MAAGVAVAGVAVIVGMAACIADYVAVIIAGVAGVLAVAAVVWLLRPCEPPATLSRGEWTVIASLLAIQSSVLSLPGAGALSGRSP